jgi:hypothetical protein
MESTIALGMTCDAWRRWRSPRLRRRQPPGAPLLAAGLRILPIGARRCCHFTSTTRNDHDQKVLNFLLVCRICGIEKLVHRQPYVPSSSLIPPWALVVRRRGSVAAECSRSGRDQVGVGAGQCVGQLAAGTDVELDEHVAQMPLNRPRAEK